MKTEYWKRQKVILHLSQMPSWAQSHVQHPVVVDHPTDASLIRIYFGTRTDKNQSVIVHSDLEKGTFKVVSVLQEPLAQLGLTGCFDERGMMPSCLIRYPDHSDLYYLGFNQDRELPFRTAIGVLRSDDKEKSFYRPHLGPILDRQANIPLYCSCPWVVCDDKNNPTSMFFLSGYDWKYEENKWRSFYHIQEAQMQNDLWVAEKSPVLVPETNECAIARPMVFGNKMYFSSRYDNYHLGVAYKNQNTWQKGRIVLTGESNGWDSDMQAYPFVYQDEQGIEYLFYNGNTHGKEALGYAIKDKNF